MDVCGINLDTFTDTELRRMDGRIWDRIGSGGLYGWDWPTLRVTYPHFAQVIRAIRITLYLRGM